MDVKTLEELGLDLEDIQEQVVSAAALRVADRAGRELENKLILKAQAIVDAKVAEVVDKVMNDVFQPVDTWGKKTGEPTTIRKMMEKSIEKYWNEKVDSGGKPSNYSGNMPRAEYFAKNVVAKMVDYNMSSEMKKIIDAGKDKVREAMAKAVTEQLKKIW